MKVLFTKEFSDFKFKKLENEDWYWNKKMYIYCITWGKKKCKNFKVDYKYCQDEGIISKRHWLFAIFGILTIRKLINLGTRQYFIATLHWNAAPPACKHFKLHLKFLHPVFIAFKVSIFFISFPYRSLILSYSTLKIMESFGEQVDSFCGDSTTFLSLQLSYKKL